MGAFSSDNHAPSGCAGTGLPAPIFSYARSIPDRRLRMIAHLVERAGGRRRIERLYAERRDCATPSALFTEALRLLDVRVACNLDALATLPDKVPVVFVANHPFGILDGMVLACLAGTVREEVRIVAHSALCRIPEMRPYLLPVDFSGTREAHRANVGMRSAATAFLASGGALVLFPAGNVSTTPRPFARQAVDAPWGPLTARLIRDANAHVVPVHFTGQNSRLFQMVSHVNNPIRQALIFRESLRRRGSVIEARIGTPIPPGITAAMPDRAALMSFLRERTFALAHPDLTAPPRPFAYRIAGYDR